LFDGLWRWIADFPWTDQRTSASGHFERRFGAALFSCRFMHCAETEGSWSTNFATVHWLDWARKIRAKRVETHKRLGVMNALKEKVEAE